MPLPRNRSGRSPPSTRAAATPKPSETADASAADSTSAKVKVGTAKRKKSTGTNRKRLSALDAAAQVLQRAGKPMRCSELIDAMAEQGLWRSPNGKTPHATLHAAIMRRINRKGRRSRFEKVGRGRFDCHPAAT